MPDPYVRVTDSQPLMNRHICVPPAAASRVRTGSIVIDKEMRHA